ncbi:glucose-fructose oxidoreductase [Opitutaceae bacterium EW11]|nr:glucose-fructose oxidoreductase [Opitutaceae bacterium EW11]
MARGGIGLAVLGSGAFPARADDAAAPAPANKKLGVALVGLGNYSQSMLGPSLRETRWCELRGIVSGSPEKRSTWARDFSLPAANVYDYEHFDQIADNPDIDIVYIVLPNFLHAEYTIRAARAGKHVICEKPMAMNPEECRQMIAACRGANRQLSIGYRLRFDPFHLEAMRIGQEKVFGPIKLIEASLGFNYPNPQSWRFKIKEGGGGAIMDLGVYCVEAARYLTGENPVRVTAQAYTFEKDRFIEIPESYHFQMEFPNGAISTHTVSYSSYVDRLYAASSQGRGWIELEPAFQGGAQAPIGRTHEGSLNIARVNQTTVQMDDFARCIIEGRSTRVSGEEGLADMTVIAAIKDAVLTGRTTTVSDAPPAKRTRPAADPSSANAAG